VTIFPRFVILRWQLNDASPHHPLAVLSDRRTPALKDNLNASISSLNPTLNFNPIVTHYISPTSKSPTRLYVITLDLLETYFSRTFNVLSTPSNLKYNDVEPYPPPGINN